MISWLSRMMIDEMIRTCFFKVRNVSAQKFGVGVASAALEPCILRLKAHLQKLIPGLRKGIPPIIELIRL